MHNDRVQKDTKITDTRAMFLAHQFSKLPFKKRMGIKLRNFIFQFFNIPPKRLMEFSICIGFIGAIANSIKIVAIFFIVYLISSLFYLHTPD